MAKLEKGKRGLKYVRGNKFDARKIKKTAVVERKKLIKKEELVRDIVARSVAVEGLLTEEVGYLKADKGKTKQYSQSDIQNAVDPSSAAKRFDLELRDFGPYRMNYTRNGRFLALCGRKGHVAAMDWISKKLMCEINVMESAHDICWLHQETLFAVAQKRWVHFYDNQGTEIHCVKSLDDVYKMVFLPYHFLLSTINNKGFISWLDVSTGKMVEQFQTRVRGMVSSVALHPRNAMVGIGEPTGVVTFWSPNDRKPAYKTLCHKQGITAIAFHPKGQVFATAAVDRTLKIWDARKPGIPIQDLFVNSAVNTMAYSQKDTLALGLGNGVDVFSGSKTLNLYLRHKAPRTICNLEFCPFEDVLGIAHEVGFSSILVPGSGEANFDALEINPFQTKKQRKEAEVKALLGKIPAELITWNPNVLRKVYLSTEEDEMERRKNLMDLKGKTKIVLKEKKGKRRGAVKALQRKKIMKEEARKEFKEVVESFDGKDKTKPNKEKKEKKPKLQQSVLDRFKT